MAASGAIGIDLGSNNVVIALVKRGGIDILTNEGSNRETQNVVGFSQNERYIGEQAALKFKSNFKNTVAHGNRFLGMKANSPFLPEEQKYIFSTLVPAQDDKLIFECQYMGEKSKFFPEQIVAMMLQKVKHIIKINGISSFDAVLSVPSYFTEQERQALLDATRIAELKTMQLLNEHTATALDYGIFRKKEFDEKERFVAFVDFGHTKTSAYLVSFTKDKMKVIAQTHDRNLGARDMDWILYEYYVNMFEKANSVSIRKNDKARMKLLESLEKQRRVLSANSDAAMHLEYLYEDFDLNHVLTRVEFEKMIQPIIDRFQRLVQTIADAAKDVKLHSVELVGGATRIPAIQKAIQEAFKVESVSKTLSASECIARGCAIQAAILSPLFKVVDYGVEDINYNPIRCSWKFLDPAGGQTKMEIEEPKQTSILFDKGCSIPSIKSLNFHRTENVEILLTYDPVPPGADELITKFLVNNKKSNEADFNIKVRIKLNENGIVVLDSSALIEDFIEEVKEPIAGAPAPAKPAGEQPPSPMNPEEAKAPEGTQTPPPTQQFEIKKKKKTRTTDLTTEIARLHQFPDKAIRDFYEDEVKMANNDRVIQETYNTKNELEAFIYNTRQHLNGGKYVPFVIPADGEKIVQTLNEAEKWLYGEGSSGAKSVYISKLADLKKLAEPIIKRFKEFELIPDAISDFTKLIKEFETVITSMDDKYAHITTEEKNKLATEIHNARNWLNQHTTTHSTAPKTQDLPFNEQNVRTKMEDFRKANVTVVTKPKPAPAPAEKPAEKKPEEKPQGEKMETEPAPPKDSKDTGKMDIES